MQTKYKHNEANGSLNTTNFRLSKMQNAAENDSRATYVLVLTPRGDEKRTEGGSGWRRGQRCTAAATL